MHAPSWLESHPHERLTPPSASCAAPFQQDPVQVLQKQPQDVLNVLGEGEIEDSAEYGELSTKD